MVAAAATDARRDGHYDGADELAGSADGVPSPGRYIKDQRKRQGMSIDQLAAATKIPRSSLELLESDQHDALPGPVFVKGFLRCCARALGLESEVVMELVYERERALLVARRRERPSTPAPDIPVSEPAPAKTRAKTQTQSPAKQAEDEPEPTVEPTKDDAEAAQPSGARQGPHQQREAEGMDLFAGLRRIIGRDGVSLMLWFAVALFVAMVMMAAFNMLGSSPPGPT